MIYVILFDFRHFFSRKLEEIITSKARDDRRAEFLREKVNRAGEHSSRRTHRESDNNRLQTPPVTAAGAVARHASVAQTGGGPVILATASILVEVRFVA